MAAFVLPNKRSTQPQQLPLVDRSNPLANGLVFLGLPQGATLADVLTGKSGTPSGAGLPTLTNTPSGRAILHSGGVSTNSYVDFGATNLNTSNIALGPSTWFFYTTPTAAQGGLAERNDGNSVSAGWIVGIDATNKLKFIKEHSVNNLTVNSTTAITNGVPTSLAVTHDGSGLTSSSVALYIGGKSDTVSAISTGSGTPGSDAANSLYIGRSSFNDDGPAVSGCLTGSLEFVAFWKRILSAAEIASLHENRFRLFRPARRLFLNLDASNPALTGVAGTGGVGTVAPSTSNALTGNAGTGAVSTVSPSSSKALTGTAATGAVGSVTPVRAGSITGVAATATPGTVVPEAAKSITGNAATGSAGTVSPQASQTLTGAAGTGAAGAVTPNVTIPITGASATGAVGTVTASTGGSDVSAALTGVAGTGSAGTVSPTLDKGLAGNAATGAVGSIAPATAKALSGNAAAGSVGNLSAATSKALTGNAATGAAGTVSPSVTVALTGVSATGTAGSVTAGADATQALTGVSGTGAAGTVGPSITIALAGVSGTGAVGSVTAGQPLTGVVGSGSVGAVAPSTSGAITGTAATGAVGSVGPDITIALTGVQAAGQVGTVSFVSGDITIALTGVEATGAAGVLAVAGEFSAIAAAVWSYVLSNGKTAGQNVVEIRSMLDLLAPGFWNLAIEGTYTAADLLRVIAAVQAGKSTITALGGGAATVEFRAVDDSETRVTATMAGSERTEVTLNVD